MDKQRADLLVVICCGVAAAAAAALCGYAIWANERQHRETSGLLERIDEMRARYAAVPRSEFDPAEQL